MATLEEKVDKLTELVLALAEEVKKLTSVPVPVPVTPSDTWAGLIAGKVTLNSVPPPKLTEFDPGMMCTYAWFGYNLNGVQVVFTDEELNIRRAVITELNALVTPAAHILGKLIIKNNVEKDRAFCAILWGEVDLKYPDGTPLDTSGSKIFRAMKNQNLESYWNELTIVSGGTPSGNPSGNPEE